MLSGLSVIQYDAGYAPYSCSWLLEPFSCSVWQVAKLAVASLPLFSCAFLKVGEMVSLKFSTLTTFFLSLFVVLIAGTSSRANDDIVAFLSSTENIVKKQSQSYERLLAQVSVLAKNTFDGKQWDKVRNDLQTANLTLQQTKKTGTETGVYRCLLQKKAYVTIGGVEMDLLAQLNVVGGRPQPTYTVPPSITVNNVAVFLSARKLDDDLGTAKKKFDKKTIIHQALSSRPVRETTESSPLLTNVEIGYGQKNYEIGSDEPSYRLQMTFAQADESKRVGRRLQCWVASSKNAASNEWKITGWKYQDFSPPSEAGNVASLLRRSVRQPNTSYQQVLRNSTHILQQAVLDKNWSEVVASLKDQGLIRETSNASEDVHDYVIAEDVFKTNEGHSFDFYVQLWKKRKTSINSPTQSVVGRAVAGLRAKPSIPYKRAVGDAIFGNDKAIQKALLSDEAKESGLKYPIVDSIYLEYDLIFDRWISWHSWGFDVRLEFVKAKNDKSSRKRVSFTIPSSLDPPNQNGWTKIVRGFTSKDLVGEAQFRGGSESHSTNSGVKSNHDILDSVFLTKKGVPRWKANVERWPEQVKAYSAGDLRTLNSNIQALTVESREIYGEDFAALARFAKLSVLDLVNCEGLRDEDLRHLSGLAELKKIKLSGEIIHGDGFKHLQGLSKLTHLSLASSKRLTDQGVAELAKLKHLTYLSLHWSSELTDAQLVKISELFNLKEFSIWGSQRITDKGLGSILALENLEAFKCSHSSEVSAKGIEELKSLKQLNQITLGYMSQLDDVMIPLTKIKSLEYVTIHGLKITDKSIQQFRKLPNLKRVYLDGCDVTKAGVENLKSGLKTDHKVEFELDN